MPWPVGGYRRWHRAVHQCVGGKRSRRRRPVQAEARDEQKGGILEVQCLLRACRGLDTRCRKGTGSRLGTTVSLDGVAVQIGPDADHRGGAIVDWLCGRGVPGEVGVSPSCGQERG